MGKLEVNSGLFGIITTVQEPTRSVLHLVRCLSRAGGTLVAVGDRKGPAEFDVEGCRFFPLEAQLQLDFELARKLPIGHYTRKNLGYLIAIQQGARCIYETDDDNAPMREWCPRSEIVQASSIGRNDWINVYSYFTGGRIWPRGFPLERLKAAFSRQPMNPTAPISAASPIQQGLVNNSPDVDAIWRLVLDEPFDFELAPSVRLTPGSWCPFNSQSTWWWPVAYPLLYLPSQCSFRMTDIWRSFVAQRCLWELGLGVVFHAPEVVQERNQHNLLRDFLDEIPGYTRNAEMVPILEGLRLEKGQDAVLSNLLACYRALAGAGFFPEYELTLVSAWINDIQRATLRTRC
jgi:hypothetical protein